MTRGVKAFKTVGGSTAIAVRVEYVMTRQDLITALCWEYRTHDFETPLPALSNAKAERDIREALRYGGEENIGYWPDHVSEAQSAVIAEWACAIVDRAYGDAFRAVQS